jgi:hypothetical protein
VIVDSKSHTEDESVASEPHDEHDFIASKSLA